MPSEVACIRPAAGFVLLTMLAPVDKLLSVWRAPDIVVVIFQVCRYMVTRRANQIGTFYCALIRHSARPLDDAGALRSSSTLQVHNLKRQRLLTTPENPKIATFYRRRVRGEEVVCASLLAK